MEEKNLGYILADNVLIQKRINNSFIECLTYFDKISSKLQKLNVSKIEIVFGNIYHLVFYPDSNLNSISTQLFSAEKNKSTLKELEDIIYKYQIIKNWKDILVEINKEFEKTLQEKKNNEKEIYEETQYIFSVLDNFEVLM